MILLERSRIKGRLRLNIFMTEGCFKGYSKIFERQGGEDRIDDISHHSIDLLLKYAYNRFLVKFFFVLLRWFWKIYRTTKRQRFLMLKDISMHIKINDVNQCSVVRLSAVQSCLGQKFSPYSMNIICNALLLQKFNLCDFSAVYHFFARCGDMMEKTYLDYTEIYDDYADKAYNVIFFRRWIQLNYGSVALDTWRAYVIILLW